MTVHEEIRAEETLREYSDDLRALLVDLVHIDRLARAQGHSLTELLVKAGKDFYGIDVRPDHAKVPPRIALKD